MNANPLNAAHPNLNAVVSASAGTGKTWMLTTRIIRLLLAGAEPNSILAVTFTRKATAEMKERVYERIHALHTADDATLRKSLTEMGINVNDATLAHARQLYPRLINNTSVLRVSTFHSFCQDLLQRFPLEANVPPGFTLLENQGVEMESTWEALNVTATQYPNGRIANTLRAFFSHFEKLHTAKQLAFNFVYQASDWWAYTEQQDDPVAYAIERLTKQSNVPDDVYEPLNHIQTDLATLAKQFLARKKNKTTRDFLDAIGEARLQSQDKSAVFKHLKSVFLTQKNTPRANYTYSKTMSKELGEDQAQQHLKLIADVSAKLVQVLEFQKRKTMLEMNIAWYTMGALLLGEYQKIKTQKNQLDFSDLEWKTYQLLHHGDNADWVQYKLDQRINHLLFDEFQDTNPTQWQLVRPLLEELAAAEQNAPRSVFLVGDTKQSIYGFRRANPDLQIEASHWLTQRLDAQVFPLNASRRSSSAVIGAVNAVFEYGAPDVSMQNFTAHSTYQNELWGRVECLPLLVTPEAEKPEAPDAQTPLRNPLHEPKPQTHSDHHYQEAQQVAARICALIKERTLIKGEFGSRPVTYSDMYVLFKKRTHLHDFERAFKEANIPFSGGARGTFFDHIEVQDMEALLCFLLAPFDSYRLAVILRSPLFQASHNDLLMLAQHTAKKNHWWQTLNELIEQTAPLSPALKKAHQQLSAWIEAAKTRTVHDLIDHIYHTGQVPEHYAAASKPENRAQTLANLTQFLHLALDSNSGRYPSLTHFLDSLSRMRSAYINESPDQANIDDGDNGVQMMTVHASKGMEAPIVFLVDTFTADSDPKAWESIIEWPSDKDRPTHFLINPKKSDASELHIELLDKKAQRDAQEDANLLYVAMTRAKHMLIVSGSCKEKDTRPRGNAPKKRWYNAIRNGLTHIIDAQDESLLHGLALRFSQPETDALIIESGTALNSTQNQAPTPSHTAPTPFNWAQYTPAPPKPVISPSQLNIEQHRLFSDQHSNAETAQHIGIYTHALLEQLTSPKGTITASYQAENSRLKLTEEEQVLCQRMAQNTFNTPELAFIFAPTPTATCHNEVGLTYTNQQGERVYGVIDRLVIEDEHIWVVDYKSTQGVTQKNATSHAEDYRAQLACYVEGVKQLYPSHTIKAGIVFTACAVWVNQ